MKKILDEKRKRSELKSNADGVHHLQYVETSASSKNNSNTNTKKLHLKSLVDSVKRKSVVATTAPSQKGKRQKLKE
jgi:hypothetical protein